MAYKESFLPSLSKWDPEESSEGSIDPLGHYPIAENLAEHLATGIRQRQSHPRMLTCMAVGAIICSDFEEDVLTRDGITEPWQIYEWYVVEGLVRSFDGNDLSGLPGLDKVRRANKEKIPVSAKTYLKTPGTFGFHGVYRVLAENLGIIRDSRISETGVNLVIAWEKEQHMNGFYNGSEGPGVEKRKLIKKAIIDSLQSGKVERPAGWNGWEFIATYLAPYKFGGNEAEILANALTNRKNPLRAEIINFVISNRAQKIWEKSESERDIHSALISNGSSPEMRSLLAAIQSYESFSRLIDDAFNFSLHIMTKKRGKTSVSELAKSSAVKTAAKNVPGIYKQVVNSLAPLSLATQFEHTFGVFVQELSPSDWVALLIEHHRKIQKNKPPGGKAAWIEQDIDGGLVVRPQYRIDEPPEQSEEYVHYYRTRPITDFFRDLGRIKT